jgi:hypothetical protein
MRRQGRPIAQARLLETDQTGEAVMAKRAIPPVEVESEAAIMLKYIAKRLDDIRFNNERNEYWLAQIASILRDNRHVKLTGEQRNALEAMCSHG